MMLRFVKPNQIIETGEDGKSRRHLLLDELHLTLTHVEKHVQVAFSKDGEDTSEWLIGSATGDGYDFATFGEHPDKDLRVEIRLSEEARAEFEYDVYRPLFGETQESNIVLVLHVLEHVYRMIADALERSDIIVIIIDAPGMYKHGDRIRFLKQGAVVADLPTAGFVSGPVNFLSLDFIKPFLKPLPEREGRFSKAMTFFQEVRPFLLQFAFLLFVLFLWTYGMPKK